jgi:hypothetical protein
VGLSRIEHRFTMAGPATLDPVERAQLSKGSRQADLACYLALGEGWDHTADALGGAFAPTPGPQTGLKPGKAQ